MSVLEKITLEPTAALALLLGQKVYADNPYIAQYIQKIDLNSGLPMLEWLKTAHPSATQETQNRKFFYQAYIAQQIRANQHNSQVVIVGAGYDPISVQLLSVAADKLDLIIELDMSSFAVKEALLREIQVPHLEKVKFVQANVMTDNTLDIIQAYGYDANKPTVVMMEGLVFYISQAHFAALVNAFRSPDKRNFFCLDYILHWTEASTEELRGKHKTLMAALEQRVGRQLTYYTPEQITELVKNLGAASIALVTQKDIEKMRTGGNTLFTKRGEAYLELITFAI